MGKCFKIDGMLNKMIPEQRCYCICSISEGRSLFEVVMFDVPLYLNKCGRKQYLKYNAINQPHVKHVQLVLKTLDTIGRCQRPVFSLAVSQHMHKIANL